MEVSGRECAFESEVVFFAGRKLIEFDDFEAEKVSEVVGISCIGGHVVLVDESGVESGDERPAVLDVKLEAIGFPTGKKMKRWRNDEFIAGKVFGRAGKVDWDIAIVKGRIEEEDMIAEAEILVRLHRLLQHVVIVVTIKNAGFGLDMTVFDGGREQFHFIAELRNFFINAAVAARRVRKNRTVEFLGAKPRLTPAEEKNSRRAARDQLIGEHAQDARADE